MAKTNLKNSISSPTKLSYSESIALIKKHFQNNISGLNIKEFCSTHKMNYRSVLTAINANKTGNTYSRTIQKLLTVILNSKVELSIERFYLVDGTITPGKIKSKSPKLNTYGSKQSTTKRGTG